MFCAMHLSLALGSEFFFFFSQTKNATEVNYTASFSNSGTRAFQLEDGFDKINKLIQENLHRACRERTEINLIELNNQSIPCN